MIKSGNSSRIYLSTSDNICYQELSTEEGGCIHDDNIKKADVRRRYKASIYYTSDYGKMGYQENNDGNQYNRWKNQSEGKFCYQRKAETCRLCFIFEF